MAKKATVTKTLRAAPLASPAMAQWITGGAVVDDSTTQPSDDLTTQRSDDLALQAEIKAPRRPRAATKRATVEAVEPTPPTRSMVQRRGGERRQVTYYIGPRRALELKVLAAERRTTMMQLLADLIAQWLDEPTRFALRTREQLDQDQHMEAGPALVERADGSTRYRVSVYLAPEQATRFKVAALRAGREMSDIVDALAAELLDR